MKHALLATLVAALALATPCLGQANVDALLAGGTTRVCSVETVNHGALEKTIRTCENEPPVITYTLTEAESAGSTLEYVWGSLSDTIMVYRLTSTEREALWLGREEASAKLAGALRSLQTSTPPAPAVELRARCVPTDDGTLVCHLYAPDAKDRNLDALAWVDRYGSCHGDTTGSHPGFGEYMDKDAETCLGAIICDAPAAETVVDPVIK